MINEFIEWNTTQGASANKLNKNKANYNDIKALVVKYISILDYARANSIPFRRVALFIEYKEHKPVQYRSLSIIYKLYKKTAKPVKVSLKQRIISDPLFKEALTLKCYDSLYEKYKKEYNTQYISNVLCNLRKEYREDK